MADKETATSGDQLAHKTWARYEEGRLRGHSSYQRMARRNDDMYLGAGLQWRPEDLEILAEEERPAYEINVIKQAVDSAAGYQINNRMDISFAPRGGDADDQTATLLNRVVMQIADQINLHWTETEVFTDGMIQQRGFYDIRMAFDDQLKGSIEACALDPLDVIPDPDAKSYDPSSWLDVIVSRWLTLDEVAEVYGQQARDSVEQEGVADEDQDFGEDEMDGVPRSKFGQEYPSPYSDHAMNRPSGERRVRLIDRQFWQYTMTKIAVTEEGDVVDIEGKNPEDIAAMQQAGAIVTKRMKRRIRWVVATQHTVLHDDWSPYPFFTVIPYFPYFRRGQTRGMVDNAIGPQEIINKAISQYIHVINSIANSGWIVEENSLVNLSVDDLQDTGSMTGLVIVHKKDTQPPQKIRPNEVPTGIEKMIDRAFDAAKEVTVPDAMRGLDANAQDSGLAIQSRQFAAQQQLAVALDNLARTRHMIARAILWMIQNYYDEPRIFRITETAPFTGKQESYDLGVNVPEPLTGNIINDLTVGIYDVVVTDQPLQVTFNNSQFDQALKMREMGVNIPDYVLIQNSQLANKSEILEQMQQSQEQRDPLTDAEVQYKQAMTAKVNAERALTQANTIKTRNQAVNESVESQYSAMQSAQIIAQLPQVASLADQLLGSAGFVDQDPAPVVPQYGGMPAASVPDKYVVATQGQDGQATPEQIASEAAEADANGDGTVNGGDIAGVPENTNPLTPTNPGRGLMRGIEGGDENQ